MSLEIKLTKTALSYFERLDASTRERIAAKLAAIAAEPNNFNLSKPLTNSTLRSSRVGGYRILLSVTDADLVVADIGPRGEIYRKLSRKASAK